MIPKIGITTQIISEAKWYKCLNSLGYQTVEINRLSSKLFLDLYFLEKVKRYTRGYDLSIHSGTRGVFHSNATFTNADLAVLTAELEMCSILGIEQFVFHLNCEMLTLENKKRLKDVIDYAADLNVMMMYESDSNFIAHDTYDVLESFNDLGYVLDIGHLNNSSGKRLLGCDMDDFVRNVKSRVVYIHASNNCGTRDDHFGLNNGTLDWEHILDSLDLSKVNKIIIEVRNTAMVKNSFGDLESYIMNRFLLNTSYKEGNYLIQSM
ncbi:MAG: TIM barrel protein [Desulfatiglans sp.]|jgi:sugar phosphate isomerase/epimerase|nr:TIM barrel protein [Desulfatiglans sp.]